MIVAKKEVYLKNSEDSAMMDLINVGKKQIVNIKDHDTYDSDFIKEVKKPTSISAKKTTLKKNFAKNASNGVDTARRVHNTRKLAAATNDNKSPKKNQKVRSNVKKVVGSIDNDSKSPNKTSTSSNRPHRRVTFRI